MSDPRRDPMTELVDKQLLTYAVQKAIFCAHTGQVLDIRHAVLLTLTLPGGGQRSVVMTAAAWDDIGPALRERAAAAGAQVEVRDGRALFASKRGRR